MLKQLPETTGDPPVLTVCGWKIYYNDNSVLSSKITSWDRAPSAGVVLVSVFFEETYMIWITDHVEFQNRKTQFVGDDYYWKIGDMFYSGNAADLPAGLPAGAIKIGSLVPNEMYDKVCDLSDKDRIW